MFLVVTEGVWDVWVTTGSDDNHGMNSGVLLTICGSDGETEAMLLKPPEGAAKPFQRGAEDRFVVRIAGCENRFIQVKYLSED